MLEDINHDRRRFLDAAVLTMAAAKFVMSGAADAQSRRTTPADVPTITPGSNTSFDSLKQIDSGVLNVGYAEAGHANGPAVMLLHG